MTDLIAIQKIAGWEKLKMLVLDSVSSPITKRVYNMALEEFMQWFQQAPRPGFTGIGSIELAYLDGASYASRNDHGHGGVYVSLFGWWHASRPVEKGHWCASTSISAPAYRSVRRLVLTRLFRPTAGLREPAPPFHPAVGSAHGDRAGRVTCRPTYSSTPVRRSDWCLRRESQ